MNERDAVPESRIEKAWQEALKREQAPADFAAGVMARLDAAEGRTNKKHFFALLFSFLRPEGPTTMNAWMRVALAAGLMLAFVVPVGYRLHRQEVARGEAARQQVMLALRIAGTQLRSIQGRTQSIHIEAGILGGESQ